MKRPMAREVAFIVGALPGVAVIFLPFVWGVVPLSALLERTERDLNEWPTKVVVSVALLAFPILVSTVRQALFGPLTKWEIRSAHVIAFGALAMTSVVMVACNPDAIICPTTLVAAAGAAIVLAATRKGRVPPHVHAHVAMLVAWMPNAGFCLLDLGSYGEWGAGFYLAIVAFAAYAVEATVRGRRALRSGGVAGAEEAGDP